MRVVATAGHVDHGKSTLVLALTGTDPDRLPEEKARGLTIDLGFAFTTLPSGTDVGFVDVPGHTRFIKNMLAGVGAVEVALLVVAANEGWKPQSEEHLRILDLLDIRHGIVAITKADLVDDETLDYARLEVEEHLAGTTFESLEIVTCAPRTGRGIDDVRAALDRALASAPSARDIGRPRLWIDRVFAAKGAGTVVTGTLSGGTITVDDELEAGGHPVRVRALEQHGSSAPTAAPGERVALNLVGVDRRMLTRGDAVVRPDQWRAVDVVDVAITEIAEGALPPRGRVSAAIGSGDHRVWCRRLDSRFARIRLPRSLPLVPGDRFVLRDTGSGITIAGAEVLDVAPRGRAADAPAHLERPVTARLLAPGWVPVAELEAASGTPEAAIVDQLTAAGAEAVGGWVVDRTTVDAARTALAHAVTEHHREHPSAVGLPTTDLAAALGIRVGQVDALVAATPAFTATQGQVHSIDHRGRATDTPAGAALIACLDAEPFAPPPPDDPALARALTREGALVDVNGIYFSAGAVDAARARVVAALREQPTITIADARDILGSTRKYVVPLMTHLDAIGVTRRRGDDRIAGPRSGLADP